MKRVGVFIDGSNVFWGAQRIGVKIDYKGVMSHMRSLYNPVECRYYGVLDESPRTEKFFIRAEAQRKFYLLLKSFGYSVITKPLKYIWSEEGKCIVKGDMDIDIITGIYSSLDQFDHIVLMSGDSDYLPAIEKFYSLSKTISIYSWKNNLSWELKTFAINHHGCNYVLLDDIAKEVVLTK